MIRPPPRSTRTHTLFPYTTLFRSERRVAFIDAAPQMIDFLVAQGIKLRRIPSYPDHYSVAGESVPGRTVVSELFDIKQLGAWKAKLRPGRSEEHTSELQSLMSISYAVFCLKKKTKQHTYIYM